MTPGESGKHETRGKREPHLGATLIPSKSRPIDLVHLACQTLGDEALEREILDMFLHQLETAGSRMAMADEGERRRLAHGLVGSARGVGAFTLAACAAEIEAHPSGSDHVARFAGLAEDVRVFVSGLDG